MRAFILLLGLFVGPQFVVLTRRFDSDKVFRVRPQNEEQVTFLKDLASSVQPDFWHPPSVHHIGVQTDVDFHVSSEQANYVQMMLEQNKMQYEIIVHNLQEEIENQLDGGKHFREKYRYTRYNEWEKIVSWTERMATNYPKLVSRIQIGKTYEERPIYLLKVGKESGKKKAIFMDCGIHAREWISPAFCQWFVMQAVRTYGNDKFMTKLLDNLNFHVVPVLNIDGYIWTWTQDRLWRKNRANNTDSDCIGTDLNRNFNASWGVETEYGLHEPCESIYCGASAESEPETKAVVSFIRDHLASIKGYISFHSYSQLLLFPYGYTNTKVPNHEELERVAKGAVEALSSLYNTSYVYGATALTICLLLAEKSLRYGGDGNAATFTITSKVYPKKTSNVSPIRCPRGHSMCREEPMNESEAQVSDPCTGTSLDWAYDMGIKYSFVFELRDRGWYRFLLPESKIRPTCKETMLAVKHIVNYILSSAQ